MVFVLFFSKLFCFLRSQNNIKQEEEYTLGLAAPLTSTDFILHMFSAVMLYATSLWNDQSKKGRLLKGNVVVINCCFSVMYLKCNDTLKSHFTHIFMQCVSDTVAPLMTSC